jgi:hypothetical protein
MRKKARISQLLAFSIIETAEIEPLLELQNSKFLPSVHTEVKINAKLFFYCRQETMRARPRWIFFIIISYGKKHKTYNFNHNIFKCRTSGSSDLSAY